ncbi:MAG TPA: hemolysin III family protein [Anaerolineales bacterium]|nr:hemolysin III family protein [Anaerolineales bacterium]
MLVRFVRSLREPVNGLTHLGAAVAALAGMIGLLVVGRSSPGKQVSLLIYGCTLVLLFSASALYHSMRGQPGVMGVLRKLDHSAIFLLIAGSYTPFCYNVFSGFWKWGLLAIVWSLAFLGVVLKVVYMRAPRWLSTGMYLLLGWLVVAGIQEMLSKLPVGALIWLGAGGLLYTVGAVVYATKIFDFVPDKFGFHEVWHVFVILGALAHFVAIAAYVAPPA